MAYILILILLPLIVQGQQQIFQLVTVEDNQCLQIQEYKGTFVPCKKNSATLSENTVFLTNPDSPGNLKIQIFSTKYCLDREQCHSDTSNLRYFDCGHCGAIHWSIDNNTGAVMEDGTNNCIYRDSSGDAYIHHCTDGFQKFMVSYFGYHFQLKSELYGDCFGGDRFMNCANAPTFYATDLPGYLSIHIYIDPSNCIDREHCHSATSNIRIYNCSHCGAVHWTIDLPIVSEDGQNNCVNRCNVNGTIMEHCSDGYEEFIVVIFPSNVTIAQKLIYDNPVHPSFQFSGIDPKTYFEWDLSRGLRGVRLSRCINHGALEAIMELEFVHNLPYVIPNVQYIVTRIHVYISYSYSASIFDIMERVTEDNDLIIKYRVYYGMIDGSVTNNDGLLSSFVTNLRDVDANAYTPATINQLLHGIRNSAFNNDQYKEMYHIGPNNGYQCMVSGFQWQRYLFTSVLAPAFIR